MAPVPHDQALPWHRRHDLPSPSLGAALPRPMSPEGPGATWLGQLTEWTLRARLQPAEAPRQQPAGATGATPAEEDPWRGAERSPAELVQIHQLEVLAENFPRTLLVFAVLYSALSIGTLGLLCWLIVGFVEDIRADCDVPLRVWAAVDFGSTAYHAVHGAVLQYFCSREANAERPLPRFERLHLVLVTLFDFVWLSVGLHWLRQSETCSETAPELYRSAEVYAITSMVGSFFICLNMVGIYSILSYMLRTGVLRTKAGAPQGTLLSQQVIKFSPELEVFKQNPDCSVCLAAFGDSLEVRQTGCGHVFHSRCLGNWLKVSCTCPLCRQDLAPPPPLAVGSRWWLPSAGPGEPAAGAAAGEAEPGVIGRPTNLPN